VDREGGRGKRLLNCEVKEGVGTKKVYSERKREMVGSGTATDRSKEAVGMMALHEALRTVCLNSDWTYSVFWTIRPRPYVCVCVRVRLCVHLCMLWYFECCFLWCFLIWVFTIFLAEE